MSCYIGCTRFTNETLQQNRSYIVQKDINGCIYGVPRKIPSKIPVKASVIVFEMNNDENKLIGAGLIKNWLDAYKVKNVDNLPFDQKMLSDINIRMVSWLRSH